MVNRKIRRKILNNRQRLMRMLFMEFLFPLLNKDTLYNLGATCLRWRNAYDDYLQLSRATCIKSTGEKCTCIDCRTADVFAERLCRIRDPPQCVCEICEAPREARRTFRSERRRLFKSLRNIDEKFPPSNRKMIQKD
jgi:hypothetical protein